jgi:putative nucleotidyltransferase with HDIG domain
MEFVPSWFSSPVAALENVELSTKNRVDEKGEARNGKLTGERPSSAAALRVLAVDNDPVQIDAMRSGLRGAGYDVETELSGVRTLDRLDRERFDALVIDLRLGATSGLDVLRTLRQRDPSTAVLLISGYRDQQIAVDAMREGADDFVAKPFKIDALRERLESAVQRRRGFCERLLAEHKLTEALRQSNTEILRRETELQSLAVRSIRSLVLSLEAKDPYTKDHSIKVAHVSIQIAKHFGLSQEEQRNVRLAGLLHDVGKIGIRENVLHKPGKLDDTEVEHMRLHPLIGARILLPLSQRFPTVVDAVRSEHERFDGKGYPDGLRGEQIPFAARMIAVADCYDAITSNRPYRGAQAKEYAASEIAAGSGTQFDPQVVQAFLELLPRL